MDSVKDVSFELKVRLLVENVDFTKNHKPQIKSCIHGHRIRCTGFEVK